MPLKFISLFAGIGGFDLGLERAGMKCVGQVEIDEYCQKVLAKHWPDVPRHDDVKTFTQEVWEDWEAAQVLCGGYPCQPFSYAGKREGGADPRHLWPEFARVIRDLRPRVVLLENVPGHTSLGFGQVLGDLAEMGFDAEWAVFPASAFGAWHERKRLFVIAYANGSKLRVEPRRSRGEDGEDSSQSRHDGSEEHVADSNEVGRERNQEVCEGELVPQRSSREVPDTEGQRCGEEGEFRREQSEEWLAGGSQTKLSANASSKRLQGLRGSQRVFRQQPAPSSACGWEVEPDVGRVAHGVPNRVHRIRALGNAIVPQCAEYVGRCVIEASR